MLWTGVCSRSTGNYRSKKRAYPSNAKIDRNTSHFRHSFIFSLQLSCGWPQQPLGTLKTVKLTVLARSSVPAWRNASSRTSPVNAGTATTLLLLTIFFLSGHTPSPRIQYNQSIRLSRKKGYTGVMSKLRVRVPNKKYA